MSTVERMSQCKLSFSNGAGGNHVGFCSGSRTRTLGGKHTLKMSEEMFNKISRENSLALERAQKLVLVLDLDHTLLHATMDSRARKLLDRKLFPDSLYEIQLQQGGVGHLTKHYVKLRYRHLPYISSS